MIFLDSTVKIKCLINTVILLCVPVGILITAMIKRDPTYEGKSAAIWVDEIRMDRDSALLALKQLGTASLPALKDALKSPSATDRCRAAWALGRLGSVAKDAVPDLLMAMNDAQPGVQYEAMGALSHIGITNLDVVPNLKSQTLEGSSFAATLLDSIELERTAENLPPISEDEIDFAMVFAKSSSPAIRIDGAIKLAKLAPKDIRAEVALQSLLKDSNGWVRNETAQLMANPTALQNFKMVVDN